VQQRLQRWHVDQTVKLVQVFKNVGTRAGASLAHPHLQMVALQVVPPALQHEQTLTQSYASEHGCHYGWELARQLPAELRLAYTSNFVACCPLVSLMPYQMRVMPRGMEEYHRQPELLLNELAGVLITCLTRLTDAVGGVAHNILWKLPAVGVMHPWYIDIVPRLITIAGLELSAGVYVNPIPPEVAAQRLRGA
jgi:UDPglucose--hexose-1-phosphate uridylyltransferase